MRLVAFPAPVYLWNVRSYDVARIREVVRATISGLELRPRGRILVKPNTVIAHAELFPHAYTRPEFLDGVLSGIEDTAIDGPEPIAVGERCGITIPTRYAFDEAGYLEVIERHRARPVYFDEVRQVEVALRGEGRLRPSIYLPEPVVRADFLVSCPKFKTHPWTTVTFALKNWIGIQDDAHRLVDHDYRLDEKIVDLHSAARPSLCLIDGIVGGTGRMLTPDPVDLGLVIGGIDPVAVDATCCRILGRDPAGIDHIRMAAAAGLGTLDERSIEIRGDVTLDEARGRGTLFGEARIPVEHFFAATPISAYSGPPPDPGRSDYCWGGCPGAAEESIDIIRQVQPDVKSRVRTMHIVYGDCRGRHIPARPGERVLLVGDRVRFDGTIGGERVSLESTYVDRSRRDVHHARAEDMTVKILKTYLNAALSSNRPWICVRGCPVSAAEHVLLMSAYGATANPYFDPRIIFSFLRSYVASTITRLLSRPGDRALPR